MQAGGCRKQHCELEISLWHSENFAIRAKFSQSERNFRYGEIFAMITKFRYDSEISL